MIELIIGLGIVGFLIAYLFFQSKDEKEHLLLRILLLGILFGVFVLIGKASLDSTQTCELVHNFTDQQHVYGNNFTYANGTATYHWDYSASGIPPTSDKGVFLFHIKEYKKYEVICYDVTDNATALTFYKVTLWIVRLISLYLLVYFIWHVWKWFSAIISGKYGRAKK